MNISPPVNFFFSRDPILEPPTFRGGLNFSLLLACGGFYFGFSRTLSSI
jgi:hypothetical protein